MSWRNFFGKSDDSVVLAILRRLYIDESRHATLFARHANQMRYSQFRARLLKISERENEHVESLGKALRLLGAAIPAVPEISTTSANSWQLLAQDLNEESGCAGELLNDAARLDADFPSVAALLRQIHEDEIKHRDQIRGMLMRSDPLSRAA